MVLAAVLIVGTVAGLAGAAPPGSSWPFAGGDLANSRSQPNQPAPNANNAKNLAVKWAFTTHGDVSATPTVANGVVYFPDFGGYMNAVNADTGALIWQKKVSDYGVPGAVSRNSPAIYGNELIFGDNFGSYQPQGAHVYAVNASDGSLIWTTQVDSNPAAQVTANPVVADGKVVVGVASNEEADTLIPGYPCCTFRGSVLALNAQTGQILWKTFMAPTNNGQPCVEPNPASGCGYSGAAVWDTPAVDLSTRQVFVGTGNNYTTPDAANACKEAADASHSSDAGCTAADDLFDAAVSLNLDDGHLVWVSKAEGWDAWNVACAVVPLGVTWCPSIESPDYDFGGAGPNLMTVNGQKLVGLGQKSGVYWTYDEATGAVVWQTLVGPGSSLGGIEWGTAYDSKRIYVPNGNPFFTPHTLADGTTTFGGSWAALDPATGAIQWQVAAPNNQAALGPATVANGVVYVGSMAPSGNDMFALDATTGKTLWSFDSGASVNSAPAVVRGTLYWGSGYAHLGIPPWTGNNKLYAFSINGN